MKIDEASINKECLDLVMENLVDVAGYIESDKERQSGYERGYMILTLGQIRGVCAMAQAMKEVLKA